MREAHSIGTYKPLFGEADLPIYCDLKYTTTPLYQRDLRVTICL